MLGIWSATNRKDNNAASGCFRNDSITVRKSAYIKAKGSDTMAAMNRDLGKLLDLGYEYVFIDEVTLMPDFIDSAALFSDIYAAQGMKLFYPEQILLAFGLRFIRNFMIELLRFTLPLFHSVNIVVYSVSTVLTSIFAMAAHFVQENWILMIKTLFQRMLRSVMTNPHGVISIPQSVKYPALPELLSRRRIFPSSPITL